MEKLVVIVVIISCGLICFFVSMKREEVECKTKDDERNQIIDFTPKDKNYELLQIDGVLDMRHVDKVGKEYAAIELKHACAEAFVEKIIPFIHLEIYTSMEALDYKVKACLAVVPKEKLE